MKRRILPAVALAGTLALTATGCDDNRAALAVAPNDPRCSG
jgi:hypothetical protein